MDEKSVCRDLDGEGCGIEEKSSKPYRFFSLLPSLLLFSSSPPLHGVHASQLSPSLIAIPLHPPIPTSTPTSTQPQDLEVAESATCQISPRHSTPHFGLPPLPPPLPYPHPHPHIHTTPPPLPLHSTMSRRPGSIQERQLSFYEAQKAVRTPPFPFLLPHVRHGDTETRIDNDGDSEHRQTPTPPVYHLGSCLYIS